jgi:hypothetical protein
MKFRDRVRNNEKFILLTNGSCPLESSLLHSHRWDVKFLIIRTSFSVLPNIYLSLDMKSVSELYGQMLQ